MIWTVKKLNDLLGRELGRVLLTDEPVYKWEWSDDLYWPAWKTGKMVEQKSPGGIILMMPEYRRDRMTNKKAVWIVTKWTPAESLTDWYRNFPGADYPANGYRIHTDWVNPPGAIPTLADTEDLIRNVKETSRMSFQARLADMTADAEKKEKSGDSELYAEIRDSFTAYLNPDPGKRGGNVSLPFTKFDR